MIDGEIVPQNPRRKSVFVDIMRGSDTADGSKVHKNSLNITTRQIPKKP
jgi:hypothetical protein